MRDSILLLKNLLLSTSRHNIYKYTKDPKKKRRIVSGYIGQACLYIMLIAYSYIMCVGYGKFGLIEAAPILCALIISVLAFVFTFFKTNGYLFNFKEYDMLMSLPFKAKTVAACKFLYMYINSLPWYLSVSLAMMVGYGYYARPQFYIYIVWFVLSFVMPVIPMLIASFLGFLIARVSTGFKRKGIIQIVLTFLFVIFLFSIRFIVEDLFRNNKVEATLSDISDITGNMGNVYIPAGWFAKAITDGDFVKAILLIAVSAVLFAIVFALVGGSYRNINSALKSHAAAKKFKMRSQKQRSVINAIAFKEFKRMIGSTVYMVNGAMGVVLASLLGIIVLIIGFEKIIEFVTNGAPFDYGIVKPAIPLIAYFFIGMVATTACSPSLEGKNYWIVQSLPIKKETLYKGKILFNMYLSVPFMVFSIVCMSVSANASIIDTLLYLLLGLVLCAFSSCWGCVCGVKHMRLDWENEIEVIKQSSAVAIYMFPNMIAVLGLAFLVIYLSNMMDVRFVLLLLTAVATVLTILCYMRVMKLSK
ncbi:MAG: hypothetical protein K5644_04175 [Lachnospiraceae bacterium]|nr:hypothetical protein [Lachnospiraceae bacterium]